MSDIFINETSLCVCHPADVERPWEAASSGWVDWQVWNQPGEAHDAGDRAAVPERLYIAAAQRGEVTADISLFVCGTASAGFWMCLCVCLQLALYVLSFLAPRDLLQAAQTCCYWRILAEDNLLWREKCHEEGKPKISHFPCLLFIELTLTTTYSLTSQDVPPHFSK